MCRGTGREVERRRPPGSWLRLLANSPSGRATFAKQPPHLSPAITYSIQLNPRLRYLLATTPCTLLRTPCSQAQSYSSDAAIRRILSVSFLVSSPQRAAAACKWYVAGSRLWGPSMSCRAWPRFCRAESLSKEPGLLNCCGVELNLRLGISAWYNIDDRVPGPSVRVPRHRP